MNDEGGMKGTELEKKRDLRARTKASYPRVASVICFRRRKS